MSLINIKQIDSQVAQGNSAIVFDGEKNVWQKTHHHQEFTYSDLTNGSIVITHELKRKFVQVSIYDETDHLVMADDVFLIDTNSVRVVLTSFGNHVINWNVIIT